MKKLLQFVWVVMAYLYSMPLVAQNPVIYDRYTPDPAPYVHGDTLYLFVDHDEDETLNNYFTMKDWLLYSTVDMVNWTYRGTPLTSATFSSWAKQDNDCWASQCIERDGKWYWYVTATVKDGGYTGIGVAVADNPAGPYKDTIKKPLVKGWFKIDPSVFIDDDGQAYLFYGNNALWYAKLTNAMTSITGGEKEVNTKDESAFGPYKGYNDDGTPKTNFEEASWIYKRDGKYYLEYAAGGVPEHWAYSTADNIAGPWKYQGKVMGEAENSFTIHGGSVEYKGHHYMFYHNGKLPNGGGYKRSTCVEEFTRNDDGSLPFISFTDKGVEPLQTLNPFVLQEAETINECKGVRCEGDYTGCYVTVLSRGNYIKVRNVDFGATGARTFKARVKSEGNMTIVIRTGSKSSDDKGRLAIESTNGEWVDVSCTLSEPITGVQDLFFILSGTTSSQFCFDNWQFSEESSDNGKYQNPVIFADFPDPDVIRVGDTYYMVSTTMCLLPGATIVKSKDLVNWEYCAQPLVDLSDKENYSLINGQDAYAKGMWACSMKYHDGKFYILLNCNDAGAYVLSASDPEGEWEKKAISRGYYDPGMLFDNGKVYVACGINNIQMCELDEDFNFIKEKNVVSREGTGLEGSHLYKIGDYYYIYATYGGWPSGQAVFRSKNIFGPYEEKMLVEKYIDGKPNTIHQGALMDTPDGNEWWTIMQEDKGALGRMPNLQPVTWEDGWPIVGDNGKPYTTYTKPHVGATYPTITLPTDDSFRSYPLGMQWEWNHTPDNGGWTLFERPGWLRLKTGTPVARLAQARNMLTQRIFADTDKASIGTVRIDVSHLQEGDRAGICVFQDPYAQIAVEKKDGKCRLVWRQDPLREGQSSERTKDVEMADVVYLRASINYSNSKTQFYYSLDNQTFTALGSQTTMSFNLSVFVGARFGLFCYATKENEERGYADFDWFSTAATCDEADDDPTAVPPYPEDMLTAEKIELPSEHVEVMIGNSGTLPLTATFRDGRTENVASQTRYDISNNDCITIQQGRLYGMKEGQTQVDAVYTDPLSHEFETAFDVRSTFFPFSAQYIRTDFYANGTYDEATHTFRPGQYGQMGWEYANGADMSDYKYLVVKLAATSSDSHLNIFTENSIWSDGFESPTFGSNKQIVVDLKTAKTNKGVKLNTKNIRIVAFWGMGNKDITVEDIYLTNNDDYSPTAVESLSADKARTPATVYDLQGRRLSFTSKLKPGIYIVNGKKTVIPSGRP